MYSSPQKGLRLLQTVAVLQKGPQGLGGLGPHGQQQTPGTRQNVHTHVLTGILTETETLTDSPQRPETPGDTFAPTQIHDLQTRRFLEIHIYVFGHTNTSRHTRRKHTFTQTHRRKLRRTQRPRDAHSRTTVVHGEYTHRTTQTHRHSQHAQLHAAIRSFTA